MGESHEFFTAEAEIDNFAFLHSYSAGYSRHEVSIAVLAEPSF